MTVVLPPKAAAKWQGLQHQSSDLNALISSAVSRAADLRRMLQINPTSPLAKMWEEEIARLQSRAQQQDGKARNLAQLLAQISHWLTTLRPGMTLVDRKPEHQALDGDNHVTAVNRVRMKISELDGELRATLRAGPTRNERRQAVHDYVAGLVASARPRTRTTHEKFEFAFATEASFNIKTNLPAAMCFLDQERFTERLLELVDNESSAVEMTAEAKKARIVELRAELENQERIEEWLIAAAAGVDVHIERRPMASPLAVLGLSLVRATKAVAAA